MKNSNQTKKIKPNILDYIIMVFTRYLPITKKLRKKIRHKLLRRKEDIVLYEAKSYIFIQICIGLLFAEILFQIITIPFRFYYPNYIITNTVAFLLEYLCFLITTPLSAIFVYPFTGFWVRLENND